MSRTCPVDIAVMLGKSDCFLGTWPVLREVNVFCYAPDICIPPGTGE